MIGNHPKCRIKIYWSANFSQSHTTKMSSKRPFMTFFSKTKIARSNSVLLGLEAEILELESRRRAGQAQGRLTTGPSSSPSFSGGAQAYIAAREEVHSALEKEASAATTVAEPAPKKNGELLAAHEIARRGDHEWAIKYAKLHVPRKFSYAISALQANEALARGDQDGWLSHLNDYIGHFGAAPVRLGEGATLLDKFSTPPLPAVSGGALVSVIMPAWNAERTIRAAANSILKQTWGNLELLIVDDASQDGTWAAMQEIAACDQRVKIHRNAANVGPYVSKNIALSMAKGSWITGHDSDDWAHPQRLEHHLKAVLAGPSPCRASHTYMARITASGEFDTFSRIGAFSLDGVTRVSSISTLFEGTLLREQLGYWDSVRFGADSEMISRTKRILGDEFRSIPQIGMLCLSMQTSLTNHADFGIRTAAGGLSPIRAAYVSAWTKEHEIRPLDQLYMPFPNANSPYAEDENHKVPIASVHENLQGMNLKVR
jgi:hypothetical protein